MAINITQTDSEQESQGFNAENKVEEEVKINVNVNDKIENEIKIYYDSLDNMPLQNITKRESQQLLINQNNNNELDGRTTTYNTNEHEEEKYNHNDYNEQEAFKEEEKANDNNNNNIEHKIKQGIELVIPVVQQYVDVASEVMEEEEIKVINEDNKIYTDEIEMNGFHIGNFIAPRVDDYIDCDKDIIHCAAVNRILFLLKYYKNVQSESNHSNSQTAKMYQYMVSLNNNYKLSDVMDDWHHFKTIHPLNENNIAHFQGNVEINCANTQNCMYLRRYNRDRDREISNLDEEIDHQNKILMDQMDSIHAYIFHAISSRLGNTVQNQYFIEESDADDSDSHIDDEHNPWENNPETVADCNVDQIIMIINHVITGINKLQPLLPDIIEYVKQNKIDGHKITEMSRKDFIYTLKEYLNKPKLSSQIAKLRKQIINYKLQSSVNESNVKQYKRLQSQKSIIDRPKTNNKFISSNTDSKNYSFGTQYRYTPNLSFHPLYVEPKYSSLKMEMVEYFKRVNQQGDEDMLLCNQLTNIETMKQQLQPLSFELFGKQINQKSKDIVCGYLRILYFSKQIPSNIYNVVLLYYYDIQNSVAMIWQDLNNDQEKNDIFKIIQTESENCAIFRDTLEHLKSNLFTYLPKDFQFYSNCTFIKLLDFFFEQTDSAIRKRMTQYFHIGENTKLIGILKTNLEENVSQNKILKTLTKIYRKIFIDDIKPYLYLDESNRIPWDGRITSLQNIFDEEEKHQTINTVTRLVDAFYLISGFDKNNFYHVIIKHESDNVLKQTAEQWASSAEHISGTKKWHKLSATDKWKQLKRIFKTKLIGDSETYGINVQQVKSLFIKQITHILQQAIEENRRIYVERSNSARLEPYLEKAKTKCFTKSVKRLKAVWYHGINADHKISVGDPMSLDHITALVCYSQCSELCTAFRETYRAANQQEKLIVQKRRHSKYGHMGKLLYQSFVFFASTDSKVKTLYHGMSMPLLFPTTFCAFDAPTSTTTETGVALSFCNDRGIVIMFESSDSSKHIRSLDMSLFTCFDHEEEHLIFETRLH
eukprot:551223_1